MTGKAYEEDLIMAIENIGHEMKMQRELLKIYQENFLVFLEYATGSFELIASKLGDQ
jgi:hypothetical protein